MKQNKNNILKIEEVWLILSQFFVVYSLNEIIFRIPKPEDVTNLIEKQRESGTSSFGLGGSLGFGFRGSIPKMAKKVEKKVRFSIGLFYSEGTLHCLLH